MRSAAPGDFQVTVDEIGTFTFGRRAPRDVFKIRGLYAQLTGGNYSEEGGYNDYPAFAFATLKQMMVGGPDGYDLDKIDPVVDEQWESKLIRVFSALVEKELSFRPGNGAASQKAGA
jgi:hypothetical protein